MWASVVEGVRDSKGDGATFFVLMYQFFSYWLLLNVIQSLFISTMTTMLNYRKLSKTAQVRVDSQTQKMAGMMRNLREAKKPAELEYLLMNDEEVEVYFKW